MYVIYLVTVPVILSSCKPHHTNCLTNG